MDQPTKRPRIGLALGGGGARGAAHVGVLRVLEAAGVPVDCIAGTSAGAVVGAAYAAGVSLDKIEEVFAAVRWRDLFRPIWAPDGWLDNSPLAASFERVAGRLEISDLRLPFAAMATDATTGESICMREGPLGPVLRASTAIPCYIRPVEWMGRRLIDGAVTNKVPVRLARSLGADLVIAVDLSYPYPSRTKAIRHPLAFLLRVLEIMDQQLVSGQLAEAEVVIRPPAFCSAFDFRRYREQMQSGETAAQEALAVIRRRLSGLDAAAVNTRPHGFDESRVPGIGTLVPEEATWEAEPSPCVE